MANILFKTYKNIFMPNGNNMSKTAYNIEMATMCVYTSSKYALPHFKCVLRCCAQCSWIGIPSPESDHHNSNFIPIICFCVYQHIEHCTVYDRRPFNEKKQFQLCEAYAYSIVTEKLYTIKYIFMMESSIVDFHQDLYIPAIQKLAFHLPHVHIIGTHHCGNMRREAFKRH